MQTTSIKNQTNEHAGWLSELSLHKDELSIYKKRLTEVAGKNTGREIMQMIEHFQNQFLVRGEQIDMLHHDINQHLASIAKDLKAKAGHLSREAINQHKKLKETYETESGLFTNMKQEFHHFLSKVM